MKDVKVSELSDADQATLIRTGAEVQECLIHIKPICSQKLFTKVMKYIGENFERMFFEGKDAKEMVKIALNPSKAF